MLGNYFIFFDFSCVCLFVFRLWFDNFSKTSKGAIATTAHKGRINSMQVQVARKRLCSTVIYRVKENVCKGWNWKKNKQTNKQKQRQKTCLNRKKKFCETQHIAWKTWIRLFFHPCLKCIQQECCSMKINHESLESKIIVSIPKIYCYEHKMKSKYWYHQEYRHLHLFIGSFLVLFFMQN